MRGVDGVENAGPAFSLVEESASSDLGALKSSKPEHQCFSERNSGF